MSHKNILRFSVLSLFLSVWVSCDYLDKAPGVDVTEDDIFSSKTNVETLLASIYQKGIHSNFGYGNPDNGALTGQTLTVARGQAAATSLSSVLHGMNLTAGIPLLSQQTILMTDVSSSGGRQ